MTFPGGAAILPRRSFAAPAPRKLILLRATRAGV